MAICGNPDTEIMLDVATSQESNDKIFKILRARNWGPVGQQSMNITGKQEPSDHKKHRSRIATVKSRAIHKDDLPPCRPYIDYTAVQQYKV